MFGLMSRTYYWPTVAVAILMKLILRVATLNSGLIPRGHLGTSRDHGEIKFLKLVAHNYLQ